MSAPEPLSRLEAAGVPVHRLSEAQRQVLDSLSAGELAVLASLQERLDAMAPDVEAHTDVAGPLIF